MTAVFTEMMHAWIAAEYHRKLTEHYGEQGRNAFLLAVRYYASQRGRRMAKRAVRDGQPLTYRTYQEYGEWTPTEEAKQAGISNRSEILSYAPDLITKITVCPWHAQFAEMGMAEAGEDYCRFLDSSIVQGFNPEIVYEVSQTLHHHDCCIHTVRNACYEEGESHPKKPGMQKSFEYHCAHSYWSMRHVIEDIFGEEGIKIAEKILEDMEITYSPEAADVIRCYEHTDFEKAD